MKAPLAVVLVVAAILCDDSCAQKINPRNSLHDCVADNCLFRDVCLSSDRGLTYYKHPIEILGYADIDSNYPRRSPLLFNVNPEPPSLQCEPIRLSMSENTHMHIECSTCIAQAPASDFALRQQAVCRFDSKSYPAPPANGRTPTPNPNSDRPPLGFDHVWLQPNTKSPVPIAVVSGTRMPSAT